MSPAPVTRLTRQFRGFLLLALFLAGSAGVPLADAALFHLDGGHDLAGVAHVEATGATHHADECLLGVATPAGTGASFSPVPSRAELPFSAGFLTPPTDLHADGTDPGAARPRAPPIA